MQILASLDDGNKIPMVEYQIEAIDKEIGVLIAYLKILISTRIRCLF